MAWGEVWVREAYRILTLVMCSFRLDSLVREGSILDPCYDMWECYMTILQQLTLLCMSLLITVSDQHVSGLHRMMMLCYICWSITSFEGKESFFCQGSFVCVCVCMHVCMHALLS